MLGAVIVIALVGYGLLEITAGKSSNVGWILIGIGVLLAALLIVKKKTKVRRFKGKSGSICGFSVFDKPDSSGASGGDGGGGE